MSTESSPPARPGPLAGLKVIEMAGIGPVPLAGLILAELGAHVLRVERLSAAPGFIDLPEEYDIDRHGRSVLRVDLKQAEGRELLLSLAENADVLVEGFRPGVMERFGAGPEETHARNPRLVYARMTGFGQKGPLAPRAGHDLTYLACTGLLHAIGHQGERPVPPLNLVADYGGGTMFLLLGILAALFERGVSGRGQTVDAAMIDGASMLSTPFHAFMASGIWQDRRGVNLLDSGAPFYDSYETSDGLHVAVACLEPQFFSEFARLLPLPDELARRQYDRSLWPAMRQAIAARFATATRDEWAKLFEPTDACVAPVLSLHEATQYPHNVARGVHTGGGRFVRPSPAPRFSRTPGRMAGAPENDLAAVLGAFGIDERETGRLVAEGIVGQ